jgi:hypothetical protein
MKKLLKFSLIIMALLLGLLVIMPLVLKGPVMKRIQKEAGNYLEAELRFKDVDISLFRNFPNLGLTIYDLSISGVDTFAGVTLARFDQLKVVVNLKSLLANTPIDIRQIHLENASAHLLVLASGKSNWDIVKDMETDEVYVSENEGVSDFSISLRRYSITNFNLLFEDHESNMFVEMMNLNHSGTGDFTQDLVELTTRTDIEALSVNLDGIGMLREATIGADFQVNIDQPNQRITFGDNQVKLNELKLNFNGGLTLMEGGMDLEIAFNAPETKFGQVLSLIPAFYMSDFAGLEARGMFKLEGYVRGWMPDEGDDLPGFSLALDVADGYISYPDLPETIDNLYLQVFVKNPGGTNDATRIQVPLAKCEVSRNPFEARFDLQTPQSDPRFDVMLKSDIELASFEKLLREAGFNLRGRLKSDLEFAGKMSDFENEAYDRVRAKGYFELTDFFYTDPEMPMPISISSARADLTPQAVRVPVLDMKIGRSDLSVQGALDNMYAWFFHDTVLQGRFSFTSQLLDMNELMLFAGEDEVGEAPAAAETPMTPPVIPANIHLTMDAKADRILYDNLDIEAFKGRLEIAQQKVRMEKVGMEVLGGRILMDGYYANDGQEQPSVNFDFDLMGLDLDLVFDKVETVKSLAPVADAVKGKLTTKFSFNALLDQEMSPVMESVEALGALRTADITFQSATLNDAAAKLNYADLSQMKFRNALMDFQVENGRIFIKPFDLSLGNQPATFSGSHGIDNSLDYAISGKFPLPEIARGQLRLPASDRLQPIDLIIKIGGTFSSPKVTFETKNVASQLKDQVTQMVRDEVTKQVDKAKDEVRARAAQLIQDAEARGDKLIAEAQRTADRLRQEAAESGQKGIAAAEEGAAKLRREAGSNPIQQAAANRAGEELVRKARQEADRLNREADRRGTEMVQQATQQKESMVNQAKKESDAI